MNLKQSRYLSISITSSFVKVAQVKSSGYVEKVVSRTVDQGGPDVALKTALAGFQVKGSGVICVIPGDVATTKNLEVPSSDPVETESILALQASRHTPFNKDEILTSYVKIGSPKPNFTRVLLVIVKRDIVKDKLAVLRRAGLDVSVVQFVPEGIARFFANALKVKKTDLPLAVIDVGMQNTNFIISSQSTIIMSRNIPFGIEHLSADTEASQQLATEIRTSLETYEQEGIGKKPARFILSTNHVSFAGLGEKIAEAVGVKVEAVPYTNFIQGDKAVKANLIKDFSDETALDVLAPAIVASKCQADLVPQEIKEQRIMAENGKATFLAGVLLILLLLIVGSALLSKVYFKDAFFKKNLMEKYSGQRQEVQGLEGIVTKTRILRQYMASRDVSLEAVRELYRLTPQEIYLSSINVDGAGSLSIQGVSESMSQVFTYVTALEASPLFEGVKTKSTAAKKDRGKDVATFEIVMKLTEDNGLSEDKPAEAPASPKEPKPAK